MKYIKQFGIILLISLIGEILHAVIPLPIPASIYGIVFLFLCLFLKIIKVSDIKETSSFLLEIMPILFIPAAVGLLDSWSVLKSSWIPYLIITVVSTFAVMIVSGKVTQAFLKHKKQREGETVE